MISKWFDEYENLRRMILDEKKSYEDIGRIYGCSGSNIKKVAKRIGIELERKRKINPNETFNRKNENCICLNCGKSFLKYDGVSGKYCCLDCSSEYRHKSRYEYFLNNPGEFQRGDYNPRSFKNDILKEQNNRCDICGCEPEWNGKPLVFILDHIDGHASHNYRSNLRMICPNCDSQLETFKSRNKCGERSYYRYHRSATNDDTEVCE